MRTSRNEAHDIWNPKDEIDKLYFPYLSAQDFEERDTVNNRIECSPRLSHLLPDFMDSPPVPAFTFP
jgi:hypothetical protein